LRDDSAGPAPTAATRDEILRVDTPAGRLLGREVVEVDQVNGTAVMRYTARPEFLNRHGTVQGGFLSAMLDSATAMALYAVLPPDQTAVTTQLNVSFVKPAKLGILSATSKLLTRDHRVAETSAELRDAEGVIVATAIAKWRIIPRRRSAD
jgi:uncharacterized protein (TIGR00369 family)